MHLCYVKLLFCRTKGLIHTLPPLPFNSTIIIWMCVCMCSVADFLAKSEEHMSRLADNILDALTSGEHSKQLKETATVRNLTTRSSLQVFGQNLPAHLIHNICVISIWILFSGASYLNLLLIINSGFDRMIFVFLRIICPWKSLQRK